MPKAGLVSVGYEGFTAEALARRLADAGVSVLFDVRLTPASRKPGFSKNRLAAVLADVGIEYVHERDLGNPPDNRESFRRGDGEEGRARMRARLENGCGPALDRLVDRAQSERVAVLCVERERHRCHRQVITDMAQERSPQPLDVLHVL